MLACRPGTSPTALGSNSDSGCPEGDGLLMSIPMARAAVDRVSIDDRGELVVGGRFVAGERSFAPVRADCVIEQ